MAKKDYICPECHGILKTPQGLVEHVKRHRENPGFLPGTKRATAEQLAAAGLGPAVEASTVQEQPLAKESEPIMAADDSPVTQKDLRIRDLETQVAGLTQELGTANSHRRLGDVINHAGEACTDCQQDLLSYNQNIIKSALEGLDPAAVRDLAVSKGVIAKTLVFQVP